VNGRTLPLEMEGARAPGGLLQDGLGMMLTIEGVKVTEGAFVGERTLAVQVIDGKKLAKPVNIWINNLELKKDQHYVFRGYENGMMIGTPPAVEALAKEQGQQFIPAQAAWQWKTHFVVLVVVEPKGVNLDKE
jgi:hypothetical protein